MTRRDPRERFKDAIGDPAEVPLKDLDSFEKAFQRERDPHYEILCLKDDIASRDEEIERLRKALAEMKEEKKTALDFARQREKAQKRMEELERISDDQKEKVEEVSRNMDELGRVMENLPQFLLVMISMFARGDAWTDVLGALGDLKSSLRTLKEKGKETKQK